MFNDELDTPPSVFADRYLPGPLPPSRPTTATTLGGRAEYEVLSAISAAGFCPGYQFVEAPAEFGRHPRAKTAAETYYLFKATTTPPSDPFNISSIELSVLIYDASPYANDPFHRDNEPNNHRVSSREQSIREEIVSYARELIVLDSRIFHFVLVFFGNSAWFARVDRTRIVTTTKIALDNPLAPICGLLWRFVHTSPDGRGRDATVAVIEHDSELGRIMQARAAAVSLDGVDDHERRLFRASLDPFTTWLQVKVYDEHALQHRSFLVGKPIAGAEDLLRRGYIALDASNTDGPFVFLHDIWRAGFEQEGALLKTLNANNVPYVPTLLCHGDIPGQTTESQDLQHYRLVVKEVGVPLEEFENGRQLVHALWCCIKAHEQAHAIGVMHRDIYPGNILLHKTPAGDWVGLLNGWTGADVGIWSMWRVPENKNSWRYASVRSLMDAGYTASLPDILESFFYVLLSLAVRFLPTTFDDPDQAAMFLREYLDGYSMHSAGYRCGCAKVQAIGGGQIDLTLYTRAPGSRRTLRFLQPPNGNAAVGQHPIDDIVSTLLIWLQNLSTENGTELQTHGPMADLLRSHLMGAGWPETDKGPGVEFA